MFAAMVAQLIVLPGEKVQFIIAGLSTRFRPLTVVGAAGLAFAGWTALEIWFGQALKGALPPVYLDAISGGLFLLFGVLLVRSIPEGGRARPDAEPSAEAVAAETDGGYAGVGGSGDLDVSVLGRDVPDRFGSFLPIFVLMAVGEFGDKTQIVTISLAVQYGAHPGIWVGEMLVIVPISLANAYFFSTFAHRFDAAKAHLFGASVFFFFGLDTFLAIVTDVSIWETVVAAVSNALQSVVGAFVAAAPAFTATV
ncbi:TMEM165/GDT1 family protein [Halosimplex litoreum]|uniref:TMEM165/GDT1 family protein n=2 Tax=Halosimplex litoreum TaxID=1198301 RepID=A0A7U3WT82_9EURY|nr:TMEM165/GDT1 family protein [Halosimplex litoreum]